jgi:hypothetical protein
MIEANADAVMRAIEQNEKERNKEPFTAETLMVCPRLNGGRMQLQVCYARTCASVRLEGKAKAKKGPPTPVYPDCQSGECGLGQHVKRLFVEGILKADPDLLQKARSISQGIVNRRVESTYGSGEKEGSGT